MFSFLLFLHTDDNSNQSFLSDAYQSNTKVDSSGNSSPQHVSEAVSPSHAPYFRTEDSQPPTLGQETMEGERGEPSHMIRSSLKKC